MVYTYTYQIEGGINHIWKTDTKIESANEKGELISSKHQKKQQKCLLEMMRLLLTETKKRDIQIFAVSGTLLGALRNNGLLYGDDDIDVGFFMRDFQKLLELTKIDIHPKYKLVHYDGDIGFGIYNKKNLTLTHIDLFPYGTDLKDPNKINHIGPIINGKPVYMTQYLFPKDWLDKKCTERLDWVPFENFKIPIPSDAVNQLHHMYGNNCMTTYVPDTRSVGGRPMHEIIMKHHEILCYLIVKTYHLTYLLQLFKLKKRNDLDNPEFKMINLLSAEIMDVNFENSPEQKMKRIKQHFEDYFSSL